MHRPSKLFSSRAFAAVWCVLSAAVIAGWTAQSAPPPLPQIQPPDADAGAVGEVVSIQDAARLTVRLEGRVELVALFAIDADAPNAMARTPDAVAFLTNLLRAEPVRILAVDPPVTDRTGRRLVRVYRDPDGLYVNAELLRQGYADFAEPESDSFRTDDDELSVLAAYRQRARDAEKGIWALATAAPGPHDSARPAPPTVHEPERDAEPREPEAEPKPEATAQVVYITRTGTKYHRSDCRHIRRGGEPVSLDDARARGLEPCRVCRPDEPR